MPRSPITFIFRTERAHVFLDGSRNISSLFAYPNNQLIFIYNNKGQDKNILPPLRLPPYYYEELNKYKKITYVVPGTSNESWGGLGQIKEEHIDPKINYLVFVEGIDTYKAKDIDEDIFSKNIMNGIYEKIAKPSKIINKPDFKIIENRADALNRVLIGSFESCNMKLYIYKRKK